MDKHLTFQSIGSWSLTVWWALLNNSVPFWYNLHLSASFLLPLLLSESVSVCLGTSWLRGKRGFKPKRVLWVILANIPSGLCGESCWHLPGIQGPCHMHFMDLHPHVSSIPRSPGSLHSMHRPWRPGVPPGLTCRASPQPRWCVPAVSWYIVFCRTRAPSGCAQGTGPHPSLIQAPQHLYGSFLSVARLGACDWRHGERHKDRGI